jgi:hypothetical protein
VAFSVKRIKKLSACPGRHSDGGNLFLEVRSKTSASWIFRWQKGKHKHSQGLGSLRTFDLHEARERARKLRQSLADGIDPRAAKAARGATYRECADEAFPSLSKNWRNPKHIAGWHNRSNSYILPIIGSLAVSDIDVAAVLRVLQQDVDGKPFWEARPETAQRSRADMERVLSWATVRGLRKGDNPARWNGFLETQLPSRGKKFAPVPSPTLTFPASCRGYASMKARERGPWNLRSFARYVAALSLEPRGPKSILKIDFGQYRQDRGPRLM